jgi:hypothetical protein
MRANSGSFKVTFFPVIPATASAVAAPPGVQRLGGTSAFFTTASAYCSQPANPHAPQ